MLGAWENYVVFLCGGVLVVEGAAMHGLVSHRGGVQPFCRWRRPFGPARRRRLMLRSISYQRWEILAVGEFRNVDISRAKSAEWCLLVV